MQNPFRRWILYRRRENLWIWQYCKPWLDGNLSLLEEQTPNIHKWGLGKDYVELCGAMHSFCVPYEYKQYLYKNLKICLKVLYKIRNTWGLYKIILWIKLHTDTNLLILRYWKAIYAITCGSKLFNKGSIVWKLLFLRPMKEAETMLACKNQGLNFKASLSYPDWSVYRYKQIAKYPVKCFLPPRGIFHGKLS